MLERAKVVMPGELSHSSVHRLLSREGISSRPSRVDDEDGESVGTRIERRSFIAEHVGELWVGGALHVHRRVRLPGGNTLTALGGARDRAVVRRDTSGEREEVRSGASPTRIFSVHCPPGEHGYIHTMNAILDRFRAMAARADLLVACWQCANPGKPLAQTLRWSGNRAAPHHCDGIFIPRAGKTASSRARCSRGRSGRRSAITTRWWPYCGGEPLRVTHVTSMVRFRV